MSDKDAAASVARGRVWAERLPRPIMNALANRPGLTKALQNSGWLFFDRFVRGIVGVLVGAWVARYLGPESYGELAYVMALMAFFTVISQLGLDAAVVRDMAVNHEDAADLLGTVFRLRFFTGLACCVVALGAVSVLRPGDMRALAMTAIVATSLLFQASDTIDLWFQSQSQNKRTVGAKIVAYLAANALRVMLIIAGAPLVAFAAASLFEFVMAAGAMFYLYRRHPTARAWFWTMATAIRLLRECWPYLVSALSIIIYMRIDQLMIKQLLDDRALGIYSAAVALAATLQIFPMAISIAAAPGLARLRVSDRARYEASISSLFRLMWWTMLPIATLLAFLAEPLTTLLFGDAYRAAGKVLAIYVFCNVPIALGVVQSSWIINERRSAISVYRTLLGAVTSVVLNLLLIPRFGLAGAAISALSSQWVAAVISNAILAPSILRMQILALLPSAARPAT